MRYTIFKTDEYQEWFESETQKSKLQIKDRLLRIEDFEHFGHIREIDDDLYELKFNDGRRIYYTIIKDRNIILLLGGNKNGQDKDIKKAKSILKKIIGC